MHPEPPDLPPETDTDWPHVLVVGFKEMPPVTYSVIEALGGEVLRDRTYAGVVEEEEGTYAAGGRVERLDLPLCSFCGKAQRQVEKLVAGPGVYICNECVDLAKSEILD